MCLARACKPFVALYYIGMPAAMLIGYNYINRRFTPSWMPLTLP